MHHSTGMLRIQTVHFQTLKLYYWFRNLILSLIYHTAFSFGETVWRATNPLNLLRVDPYFPNLKLFHCFPSIYMNFFGSLKEITSCISK